MKHSAKLLGRHADREDSQTDRKTDRKTDRQTMRGGKERKGMKGRGFAESLLLERKPLALSAVNITLLLFIQVEKLNICMRLTQRSVSVFFFI